MVLPDLKLFFDWLQIHPLLAGLITYFISFFECLLIIGLLVPGTVFMTAIGTFIGIGVLPFFSITVWAIAGAITGDVLSFWIGQHYHQHADKFWLFRRYPNLLKKGERFFDKHGRKSIFIGRFVGPVRTILPFIAGMVHMPYRQFLIADIISAIAWAPLYMLPGILLGQASQQLPPEVATKLIIFSVSLLLFLWLAYTSLKSCYVWLSGLLDKQVAYLWEFTRHHPRLKSIASFLIGSRHPHSHTQLTLALACILCFIGFLMIAISVSHHGTATYFNEPIYHLMRSLRQPGWDSFFIGMTELSPRVLTLFWLLLLVFLLIRRCFWAALHWALVGLLSYGLGDILKYTMHISRPTGLVEIPSGASFPSGHTLSVTCILGFFSVLIALEQPKWLRITVYSLTSLTVFLVILSRLYLTAHWFTDVLAGLLLGLSLVTGLTLSYRRKLEKIPISISSIVSTGLGILLLFWGVNLYHEYGKLLLNYQLLSENQTIHSDAWWNSAEQQGPLYRTNRFGKTVGILNIEWASRLINIQYYLEKQGWHSLPKVEFFKAFYNSSIRNTNPKIPLFTVSNAGKKPRLAMAKYFPATHNLLILELWKAHRNLSDGIPLWIGVVYYHKTWQLQFRPVKKQSMVLSALPADELLTHDLKHYLVKNINYKNPSTSILFIKENAIHH